jgi:hypothetical protein
MPLVYHTFFAEYEGESPGDILRAVHKKSAEGIPVSFNDWWKHQQTTWKAKYNIDVPSIGEPNAEDSLLKILIDVEALEIGKKKQAPNQDRSPQYKLG